MSVRQDLVAVENKIDAVLETVNDTREELGDVKSEVRGLRNELGEVKTEVYGLKSEFGEMKSEVHGLKIELGEVKSEVHGLKSEMNAQTKLISQLPTREELATLLNMKQQLDRVREVIRDRLKVEV